MHIQKILVSSLAGLTLFAANAFAAERSGREVVESTCASCHAAGKEGAPVIGDLAAWSTRAQGGFGKLATHAISGSGKMPARGGQANLTDLEISRAIAFMSSGGRATDPSKPYSAPTTGTGEELVKSHCINCHGTGTDGAPRINQFGDWKPRLQKGMDVVIKTAIAGHKGMPARAGMAHLSDSDLRNAVTYMVVQSATFKVP
jgi:cytochrome c5